MSELYPARRFAQWSLTLGLLLTVAAAAVDVAHFYFGVEIFDKDTGNAATAGSLIVTTVFIGLIGMVFALIGAALLRAMRRHDS